MSSAVTGPAQGHAYRKGSEFVTTHGAQLPPFCVRCGDPPVMEPLKRTYYWHHPALYLMIIFPGLLIYAIVALIVRKKMAVAIPICNAHLEGYKSKRRIGGALMIAAIPFAITVSVFASDLAGWAWLMGILMLFAGAIVFAVGS